MDGSDRRDVARREKARLLRLQLVGAERERYEAIRLERAEIEQAQHDANLNKSRGPIASGRDRRPDYRMRFAHIDRL